MATQINKLQTGYVVLFKLTLFLLQHTCQAQVATTTISNVNATIMTNTKLLFGITFDSRTSLITNNGYMGYYDTGGVVIPQVDSIFHDFPMSTLRYPGNGIAVGFNWKKSIGPVSARENQNLLGTQGVPQPVKFGFDEFMAMTAIKGVPSSEIQIMVPIYDSASTGMNSTQSQASVPDVINLNADWVEYCNSPSDGNISNPGGGIDWAEVRASNGHPQPYQIKIWNIGNEPWSPSEFGNSSSGCNAYLTLVTPIVNAMLAIDPTIKITMSVTGNGSPGTWAHTMINSSLAQQGKIYALSQHFFGDENPSTLSPSVDGCNALITGLTNIAAINNIKVFIGDFAHRIPQNATAAQKDSAMQWLGANLETDLLLMLSQKSTNERANFWVYGNAMAEWHPIRKNTSSSYTLMPAAKMYKILYPAFLDRSIQVTSSSPPLSNGVAGSVAVHSSAFISNNLKRLNIVAVNRDRNNTIPFQVTIPSGYHMTNPRLITANSVASETIIDTLATTDTSGNYVMPPMSVIILEFDIDSPIFTGKCYLQGYYVNGGMMNQVLYNEGIETNVATTNVDTIEVYLHENVFPYAMSQKVKTLLKTDGSFTCVLPSSVIGNSYYIAIHHRNTLETWSAAAISFSTGTNYDFSTNVNKTYGDNQASMTTNMAAFYSGDINQDGSIDVFDYLLLDPDIVSGNSGYLSSDLNGDGSADVFDYLILYDGIINGLGTAKP